MTALDELMAENARQSCARFFLRCGQAGNAARPRDESTKPLFPLHLILEAEGLLAADARRNLQPHEKGHGRSRRRAGVSRNGREVGAPAALPAPLASAWRESYRADPAARPLADRHYNRQKVGSPQFVPPGACLVLLTSCERAVWVTSWPKAEYVQHAWAGAWVNSLFRREGGPRASDLIRMAVAHTRAQWAPPELGMVSFVDPKHVAPVMRRGKPIYGYCYLKAGFRHVGFTKAGLWVWQMLPHEMPEPLPIPSTPEGRRSLPAGALERGSPLEAARDVNPGGAAPGGEAEYLRRCEALIAGAAMEVAA